MLEVFGLPYDEEIFMHRYQQTLDKELIAILESGAVVHSAEVENIIAQGSDSYTIPFFNILGGEQGNYDGVNDIVSDSLEGYTQTGIVVGRQKGFTSKDFAADMTGSDPMGAITDGVARYNLKKRQKTLLLILKGIFADKTSPSAQDTEFKDTHIVNTGAPIEVSDVIDATTDALGDASGDISLAIMHSHIAASLQKKKVLEYMKYTDANGIEKQSKIAYWDGHLVIVDDGVGTETDPSSGLPLYTTYLCATGSIILAPGRLSKPVETERDAAKAGGTDFLYSRDRYTFHPNGFTYVKPTTGYTGSPTDAQLSDGDNWTVVAPTKNIGIIALKTLR